MPTFRLEAIVLTGMLWAFPPGVAAQLRPVVSSEVAVSGREASLHLGFGDGGELRVSFKDGEIRVDGAVVGRYTRGDPLDIAWRELLGDVVSLDDGPLAEALVAWTPPSGLSGSSRRLAELLDQRLEATLSLPTPPAPPDSPAAGPPPGSLLAGLLRRATALQGLTRAVEGLDLERAVIHLDRDVNVPEGEVVAGPLVVVGGDLEVEGTVMGDVVVVDGSLRMGEGGRVTGRARILNGEVEGLRRGVEGGVVLVDRQTPGPSAGESSESRAPRDREGVRGWESYLLAPVRAVGRAVGGLLQTVAAFLLLTLFGAGALHFAGDRLERVAGAARTAPARGVAVGLAGLFLLLPAWVLGVVALAVSIIGIPLLLAWIPLFPLAAFLAMGFGYLAVARNVGAWVSAQEFRGLEWLRPSNPLHLMAAGLAALLVPWAAASAAHLFGGGLVRGLALLVAGGTTVLAVSVGFGAVLLTRLGQAPHPSAAGHGEDEVWASGPPFAGASDQTHGVEPGVPGARRGEDHHG